MKLEGVPWFAVPRAIFELCNNVYELTVMAYLFMRAGPHGGSWPSHQTIAQACHISRRTVINATQELKSRGLLRVGPTWRKNGSRRSNTYQLLISSAYRQGSSVMGGGAGHAPGVVQGMHQVSAQGADPELSFSELYPVELHRDSVSDGQGAVARAVSAYRNIPGITVRPNDGGVLASLVRRHGLETVLQTIVEAEPSLAAADNAPLMLAGILRKKSNGRDALQRRVEEIRAQTPVLDPEQNDRSGLR